MALTASEDASSSRADRRNDFLNFSLPFDGAAIAAPQDRPGRLAQALHRSFVSRRRASGISTADPLNNRHRQYCRAADDAAVSQCSRRRSSREALRRRLKVPWAKSPAIEAVRTHKPVRKAVAPAGAAVEFAVGALTFLKGGEKLDRLRLLKGQGRMNVARFEVRAGAQRQCERRHHRPLAANAGHVGRAPKQSYQSRFNKARRRLEGITGARQGRRSGHCDRPSRPGGVRQATRQSAPPKYRPTRWRPAL